MEYCAHHGEFKIGLLVRRRKNQMRYSNSVWKIVEVHHRHGEDPLLDLEMVDTGTGKPTVKYVSHKFPACLCRLVNDQLLEGG